MVILMMPTTRETVLKRRLRDAPSGVERVIRRIQIGDFLILHLLGLNINTKSYSEILTSLFNHLCGGDNDTPSAPSTLEMAPIYPEITKYGKESET
jgi:innexin